MVEVSCFSTTTADAINTAKPCRAACDLSGPWEFSSALRRMPRAMNAG